MKKTLFITLLALLGLSQVVAQEYEYVPFVREGVKWVYYIYDYNIHESNIPTIPDLGDNMTYRTLELKGDTVINGKTYKAMHKCIDDRDREPDDVIPIYLREEDKVVYGIIPDGKSYSDCPVSNFFTPMQEYYNGEEFVIYDFKDPVAYWDGIFASPPYQNEYHYNLISTDTIAVGNHTAKCYDGEIYHGEITNYNVPFVSFQMIEGIGWVNEASSFTLALQLSTTNGFFATWFGLSHVVEDGEIVYPQGHVDDRYSPLIRKGLKWVNERVSVIEGDTTCTYYTYEYDGNYPEKDENHYVYKALYSKHYNESGEAELVAGLRELYSTISCFKNEPLKRVIDEDRNLINFSVTNEGTCNYLYHLKGNPQMGVINKYILLQREPFLNTENFVMVDPIEIDGVICSRCAYIGEQGDTLAYVVEGIGFDSYDMGDLLTPFTKKPDPNADYQEWCGLSHVVKDGQIIYKGMRYHDDILVGIDEVVTDKTVQPLDPNYYNLMGQPVGKDVPTTPGIYIHQGKKIVIR